MKRPPIDFLELSKLRTHLSHMSHEELREALISVIVLSSSLKDSPLSLLDNMTSMADRYRDMVDTE
jgi:hypothetical protein